MYTKVCFRSGELNFLQGSRVPIVLRKHSLKLMRKTPCPSVFRVYGRTTHVTGSAIEAKAAFSAPGNLSTHDDHDDVDRAPADGDGALLWNAAADLVADRGGGRPKILPTIRIMDRLGRRQVYSALLHLGADSSSAGRPAPFRLGYRTGI